MKISPIMLVVLACVALSATAAPPSVNTLYPAGGQLGQTVETIVGGKLEAGTKVWTNHAGVKVEVPKKGTKIKVIIPADTEPGLCWLRFYNEEGATSLRPFSIGTLSELVEKEPNNTTGQAQKLDSSIVLVNGILNKAGDVDTYSVELKKEQTLVASMVANEQIGSPMDGLIQIVSPRGFILEQNDDDHGFDPQVVFTAKTDGTYFVRVFGFPDKPNSSIRLAGGAAYIYRLTITTGPFINHAYPMAVTHGAKTNLTLTGWNIPQELSSIPIDGNIDRPEFLIHRPELSNSLSVRVARHATAVESDQNDLEHPQPIGIPMTVTGCIEIPGDVDAYTITAKKGQKLNFRSESHALGFPLDPVLRLVDATGKVLKNVETRSITELDESLAFTVPSDGKYQIRIRDLSRRGGFRFVYRLTVDLQQPDYSLSVAADNFVLNPGKPLEIPVSVTRLDRFTDEIQVSVDGLPAGVTADSVKSENKGGSAKSVKLILNTKGAAAFSGPIRIVGKSAGKTPIARSASATIGGSTEKTQAIWLTAIKQKPKK